MDVWQFFFYPNGKDTVCCWRYIIDNPNDSTHYSCQAGVYWAARKSAQVQTTGQTGTDLLVKLWYKSLQAKASPKRSSQEARVNMNRWAGWVKATGTHLSSDSGSRGWKAKAGSNTDDPARRGWRWAGMNTVEGNMGKEEQVSRWL